MLTVTHPPPPPRAPTPRCYMPARNSQYEIFTSLPDPVEGDLTISVTAKLGADGDASHWKVGLFNHDAAVSTWSDGVALIGRKLLLYCTVRSE